MHKISLTYAFYDDYFNQLLSIYYKGDTSFFSLTKVIYHSIIRNMKVVKHSCQGVTFVKYICILFRLFNIDINLLIQTNSCAFQYVLFLNAIKIRINHKYPFSLMELCVKFFFSEILYWKGNSGIIIVCRRRGSTLPLCWCSNSV